MVRFRIASDVATLHGLAALHGAAWSGHMEAARLLLQDEDKDVASAEGVRPLHLADAQDAGEVVNVLLKARADVNTAAGDGKTALHAAALRGCLEVVQLLLNAGADKDAAYYASLRDVFWRLASVDFEKKQLTWVNC